MPARAIVTLSIGEEAAAMARVAHPRLRAYAARCGAEFVVIDRQLHPAGIYFDKFQLADLLGRFGRVAFIDTDTLVSRRCPDLFAAVPERCFAAYLESAEHDRQVQIAAVQGALGEIGWRRDYFNNGVMVLAPAHAAVAGFPFGHHVDPWFPEQTVMNYNLRRLGLPFHPLPKTFNHFAIRLVGDRFHLDPWRFGAGIIHYAGPPEWKGRRLAQMTRDDAILERIDRWPALKAAIAGGGRCARLAARVRHAVRRRLLPGPGPVNS